MIFPQAIARLKGPTSTSSINVQYRDTGYRRGHCIVRDSSVAFVIRGEYKDFQTLSCLFRGADL